MQKLFPVKLSLACIFIASPAFSQSTTLTFTPSKDNTLYESTTGTISNGAGDHLFAGRVSSMGGGARRRGLIAFDLSQIPAGSTVDSVSLTLRMSLTVSGGQPVSLHRVTADWGEGTSDAGGRPGEGTQATTDDATWLHRFFSTIEWNSPGGDFNLTESARQTVGNVGSYTWSSSGLVNDVQGWVDDPSSNFGWAILGNEDSQTTAKRFDSKDHPVANNRPMLSVTFLATSVDDEVGAIPDEFSLAQNYPNPFNPNTIISYTLPQSANVYDVKLEIYNVIGQKVRVLVDASRSAGTHRVDWDGRDDSGNLLPTGIYVYRLQAGPFSEMKRMVLIK